MDLLAADTTGAALLIGVISPWIIAVVNRPSWSSNTRAVVAIVVSLVLGLAVAAQSGAFDTGWEVVATCTTVLVTSQACYRRLFPGSQSWLEGLTSGRRKKPPAIAEPAPTSTDTPVEVLDDDPGRHAEDRVDREPRTSG